VHRFLTVLVALLAVGCSADPGHPRTLPTFTATSTPTTTPTTSDRDAATQVVRRYYALLNELPKTMDSRGMASLMAADCRCRAQLAAIDTARSKGEHYIDHVELVSLTPVRDTPTQFSVLVEYNADRGGLVDSHGRRVTTSEPREGVKRLFRVALHANRWLIADIGSA
jgi:hypothetical protein